MSTAFVKKEILDFLAKDKTDLGQALNVNALFHSRVVFWTATQQAGVDAAIKELVEESILKPQDQKYVLTKSGFDLIYPPVDDFVKDSVLHWFKEKGTKAGETLDVHAVYLNHILKWTPRQNRAFESELKKMADEGLIEIRKGDIVLTQEGSEARVKPAHTSAQSDSHDF